MFDNVVLRSLANISFGYRRVKSILPQGIQSGMENLLETTQPTQVQLKKIESLGLSIGLDKNEILAATSPPIQGTGQMPLTRRALLNTIVCRVLCLIILIIVLAITIYFASNQGTVYAPGTRYGSIHPSDFN